MKIIAINAGPRTGWNTDTLISEAIDKHHKTPMMQRIMELREKYDLHMKIERYISDDDIPDRDKSFIRK